MQLSGHERRALKCNAALQHEVPLSALADCTSREHWILRCTNLALVLGREPSKIKHLYCNAIGTPVAYSPQRVRRTRRTAFHEGCDTCVARVRAARAYPGRA
jgi:hypothetical protein